MHYQFIDIRKSWDSVFRDLMQKCGNMDLINLVPMSYLTYVSYSSKGFMNVDYFLCQQLRIVVCV